MYKIKIFQVLIWSSQDVPYQKVSAKECFPLQRVATELLQMRKTPLGMLHSVFTGKVTNTQTATEMTFSLVKRNSISDEIFFSCHSPKSVQSFYQLKLGYTFFYFTATYKTTVSALSETLLQPKDTGKGNKASGFPSLVLHFIYLEVKSMQKTNVKSFSGVVIYLNRKNYSGIKTNKGKYIS